ncbi:MAG: hypothetical protein ACOC0P_05895 [Planctomycetota bacterium]
MTDAQSDDRWSPAARDVPPLRPFDELERETSVSDGFHDSGTGDGADGESGEADDPDPRRFPSIVLPLVLTLVPILLLGILSAAVAFVPARVSGSAPAAQDEQTLLRMIELQGRVLVFAAELSHGARGAPTTPPSPPPPPPPPPPGAPGGSPTWSGASPSDQFIASLIPYAVTPRSSAMIASLLAGSPGASPQAAAEAMRLIDRARDRAATTAMSSGNSSSPSGQARGGSAPSGLTPEEAMILNHLETSLDPARSLSPTEEATLVDELGWSARLLVTRKLSAGDPSRAAVLAEARHTATTALITMLAVLAAGMIGLMLLAVAAMSGKFGRRPLWLRLPGPRARAWMSGFAFYIWIFLAISLLALSFRPISDRRRSRSQ